MLMRLGHVRELVRYPVKSMAGVPAGSAVLGWHGLDGDRRFAFRRPEDESGFPWLTATRVAELLLYRPSGLDESTGEPLPTHVRTPDGRELALRSPQLRSEIAARLGSAVELMSLRHGIFDDAPVSLISLATITAIGSEAGVDIDRRRFRANILLETVRPEPFLEDGWVGGTLVFGDDATGPAVNVTMRDVRCMMINLDPDTARQDARVLRAAVRLNGNNAGVYGTVIRTGPVFAGQPVSLDSRD